MDLRCGVPNRVGMREIWSATELVRRESCPLCAAPAEGPILTKRRDGLPIRKCVHCTLLFLDPVPNEPALMRCYAPEYFRSSFAIPRFGPGMNYQISADDIASGKVNGLAEVSAGFDLAGKAILEVGCATGALLQSLRKYNPFSLTGIDIAEHQVAYGREHYGLDLRCVRLEQAGFSPAQFDLIIMRDVLEHVRDPGRLFAAAAGFLREGGGIFIRTPNADSYSISRDRWCYLHCGFEHVVYFGKRSLAVLTDRHNMVIERIETEGCPAQLPYICGNKLARLIREPLKVFGNRIERLRLASAVDKGLGLDMKVTIRKH
jgi:2-polyprenyl-3-methyl-5-hydroxy-6-metoxy-1,4-benzoquinol methylase